MLNKSAWAGRRLMLRPEEMIIEALTRSETTPEGRETAIALVQNLWPKDENVPAKVREALKATVVTSRR